MDPQDRLSYKLSASIQGKSLTSWRKLERAKGFEPSTPTLARLCSTPELRPLGARLPGMPGVEARLLAWGFAGGKGVDDNNRYIAPQGLAEPRIAPHKGVHYRQENHWWRRWV